MVYVTGLETQFKAQIPICVCFNPLTLTDECSQSFIPFRSSQKY